MPYFWEHIALNHQSVPYLVCLTKRLLIAQFVYSIIVKGAASGVTEPVVHRDTVFPHHPFSAQGRAHERELLPSVILISSFMCRQPTSVASG